MLRVLPLPDEFIPPDAMARFILLQWTAISAKEDGDEDTALLAEFSIEFIVKNGDWPRC
jgi:hypothetical protein